VLYQLLRKGGVYSTSRCKLTAEEKRLPTIWAMGGIIIVVCRFAHRIWVDGNATNNTISSRRLVCLRLEISASTTVEIA